jgi:hypothetical protein
MAEHIEQATAAPGEVRDRRVYVRAASLSESAAGWYEIVSDGGEVLVLRRISR